MRRVVGLAIRSAATSTRFSKGDTFQLSRRTFSTATSTPGWKWVPPPPRAQQTLEEEAQDQERESVPKKTTAKPISVINGTHLTAQEVIEAFTLNGAENVVHKPCGRMADAMVFATGRSSTHARMLAELVVKATKERRLKMFNPRKPIEGEEDWFLVDTGKLIIHLFGDQTVREKIGLEDHLDELLRRKQMNAAIDQAEAEPQTIDEEIEDSADKSTQEDK